MCGAGIKLHKIVILESHGSLEQVYTNLTIFSLCSTDAAEFMNDLMKKMELI